MMYSLNKRVFETSMLDILQTQSDEAHLQDQRDEEYRRKVIEAFFEYGRLKAIPAQRKKKRIVLEEIAKVFEPGRVYTEREVNIMIADFHDDFCTIRRELIGESLLARDNGQYWRTDLQL